MIGLKGTGWHEYALGIILVHIVCKQHQYRTNALPSDGKHILYGFVYCFRFTIVGQTIDKPVDFIQNFLGCKHIIIRIIDYES